MPCLEFLMGAIQVENLGHVQNLVIFSEPIVTFLQLQQHERKPYAASNGRWRLQEYLVQDAILYARKMLRDWFCVIRRRTLCPQNPLRK